MKTPPIPFFIFGAGDRPKLVYRRGELIDALSGAVLRRFSVESVTIDAPGYRVEIHQSDGRLVEIREDPEGIWLDDNGVRNQLAGGPRVELPAFARHPYRHILRVLHHEILVNIVHGRPVPNFLVYKKPWHRDSAMMAMVLEKTGNLPLLHDWVKSLSSPYDRNNKGNAEPDNLGQVLYLISCFPDLAHHPLLPMILSEAKRVTLDDHLTGMTDYADHPVYATQWLKFGLRRLGLPDSWRLPRTPDSYGTLCWWDRAGIPTDQPAHFDNCDDYPYLTWAEANFFSRPAPFDLPGKDYPLTWEAKASEADYAGMTLIDASFAEQTICMPHTWHAAEMFLSLCGKDGNPSANG